jgi:solute carrier family 6 amino acid transporter-like protein 5/7/9/14
MKGIKVSGKASYVTGLAPFFFLIIFLIRALTLPGALNGIAYFFTPNWSKILEPKVWFEAVTQVFFSLNVFCANLIMYASYNKFEHNIYRDSNIITTIDTFTSILAGCITFGIAGYLAHELGVEDVGKVLKGGPGLVFMTYAETISKFKFFPQLFSVLFFFMLFILGMGSLFAMTSSVITVIREQFKFVKNWHAALVYAIFGIIFGSFYTTAGGGSVLSLVDHYGAKFVMFVLAIFEIYSFCYIYGVERICRDAKFMLGFRPSIFWRLCWNFFTPAIMTVIVGYTLMNYENPKDNGADFPPLAHIIGWILTILHIIWLPLLFILRVFRQNEEMWTKVRNE